MWRSAGVHVAVAFDATSVAHGRRADHERAPDATQFDGGHHVDAGPLSRFAKIWNVLSAAGNSDADKKAKKKAKKAAHKEKQAEEKKGVWYIQFFIHGSSCSYPLLLCTLMFIFLYDAKLHSHRKRGQRPRRPTR